MMKLTVAFCNFGNVPKIETKYQFSDSMYAYAQMERVPCEMVSFIT